MTGRKYSAKEKDKMVKRALEVGIRTAYVEMQPDGPSRSTIERALKVHREEVNMPQKRIDEETHRNVKELEEFDKKIKEYKLAQAKNRENVDSNQRIDQIETLTKLLLDNKKNETTDNKHIPYEINFFLYLFAAFGVLSAIYLIFSSLF